MSAGTVKWFNNAKGWGFIQVNVGDDVFLHYSQLEGEGYKTLEQGQPVEFELKDGRLVGSVTLPPGVTGTLVYQHVGIPLTSGRQPIEADWGRARS